MYYAAHDTLNHLPYGNLQNEGYSYGGDTIAFSMFKWDYYHLKSDALNTNLYFDFDTINDVLNDIPNRPLEPYLTNTIFCAAPLFSSAYFTDVTFAIDPSFIFYDGNNATDFSISGNVEIDFGDGSGYQVINSNGLNYINVYYSTDGEKVIKTRIGGNEGAVSISKIHISNNSHSIPPTETLDFPGMNIGVYKNCNSDSKSKPIIFLEGIDVLDMFPKSRNVAEIYDGMIGGQYLSQLGNFGYDYYVVDWKNSRTDMRYNAVYLLNLIEYLKKNSIDQDNQIVIIGESMGGVIARFTLTFMESEDYENADFSEFFVENSDLSNAVYLTTHPEVYTATTMYREANLVPKDHNTRLLITMDSPHQGANIPLSVQRFYNYATTLYFGLGHKQLGQAINLFLDGKAARQLLKYHVNTSLQPWPNGTSSYGPDPSHISFYNQLTGLGDYPRFCKKMALSSGSLDGKMQKNAATGADRVASDRLLDLNFTLKARILSIPIPIFEVDLDLMTNPDGSGTFFSTALGQYTVSFNLSLFQVNVQSNFGTIYFDNATAIDVKPYCVNAGGIYGVENPLASVEPFDFSASILFYSFAGSLGYANGCLQFNAAYSFAGIGGMNIDLNICTDGMFFSFIPVASAIDYSDLNVPLNYSYNTSNIANTLDNTPVDVVMGYSGEGENNRHHLSYPDPLIYNSVDVTDENAGYFSCDQDGIFGIQRGLLCLEIGDEEIYLENLELNRSASFETEYDIRVNQRNPYYNYIGEPNLYYNTTNAFQYAVFSKQNELVTGSNLINFYFDAVNSQSNSQGLSLGSPPYSGIFNQYDQPMEICCISYQKSPETPHTDIINNRDADVDLKLFPNPLSTSAFNLSNDNGLSLSNASVEIFDQYGKSIQSNFIQYNELENTIYISLIQSLPNGIYTVCTQLDGIQKCNKLVIIK